MAKQKRAAAIGPELVQRLKRFTEKLNEADNLGEHFTCRTIRLNLQLKEYGPKEVKKIRKTLRASQSIFAQFLGVSLGAVRDWEQGLKPPNGAACRLMDEIARCPEYFLGRLKELSSPARAS